MMKPFEGIMVLGAISLAVARPPSTSRTSYQDVQQSWPLSLSSLAPVSLPPLPSPSVLPVKPLSTGTFPVPLPYNLSDWAPLFSYLGRTVQNSNPYTSAPYTGVTRKYDFTISRGTLAPDGKEKDMILINGQFPGPMITADWGDWIEVTIHNQLTAPEEGTAMHWHGFLQSTSQWSDGVPGTSECPIPPRQSRTVRFQCELYGTSWYHSHYSAQYAAGTFGPLIINGPTQSTYDEDLGPVMLSDYYYAPYFELVQNVMGNDLTKVRPASDNNLINGRGCSGQGNLTSSQVGAPCTDLARFSVKKGKKYRLRLINTSAAAIQKFSIDGHRMSVIAYDYVPIQPYDTNIVTLGVGQRADIIIEADGNAYSSYWIRTHITSGQCTEPSNSPNGWAILQYEEAGPHPTPNSTGQVDDTDPCQNDDLSLTKPLYGITPLPPSQTFNINVNFSVNDTGHLNWVMNNQTYHANYNQPMLLLAKQGNISYPYDPQWNAIRIDPLIGTVRVVLENLTPTSHPMHLHGHNMYVLAAGDGSWDGSIVNGNNPMRRDVHILPANGHLVIQWDLDNPGVWPLHCHIAWHVSAGLQVTMIERALNIEGLLVPQSKFDECESWSSYTDGIVVDQIDSGV